MISAISKSERKASNEVFLFIWVNRISFYFWHRLCEMVIKSDSCYVRIGLYGSERRFKRV